MDQHTLFGGGKVPEGFHVGRRRRGGKDRGGHLALVPRQVGKGKAPDAQLCRPRMSERTGMPPAQPAHQMTGGRVAGVQLDGAGKMILRKRGWVAASTAKARRDARA